MARHKQSVRVTTNATQDKLLCALSHLTRLGFNFGYDNRQRMWDDQHAFQSNQELAARLEHVPALAAIIQKTSGNPVLANLIASDDGLRVARQCVGVGVERCRDSFSRYSKSFSTKARKPKRKPACEFPSVQFPASQVELGVGFVRIPCVGVLKSRIKGYDFTSTTAAKSVVIKRVGDGKWNVSVAYQAPAAVVVPRGSGVVGIDINTSNTAGIWFIGADGEEDGFVIDLPDCVRADRDIRFYKARLAHLEEIHGKPWLRGKRGCEYQRLLLRAQTHRANIIKQHHLEVVRLLLSLHPEVIVFEEFDLRDGDYNGWKGVAVNQMRRALIDRKRGEDNGCKVVTVNRAYTTMTCSDCGHVQKMGSDVRTYECPECGMVRDRDLNSARNIARKYLDTTVNGRHDQTLKTRVNAV